jgi:hypothetical protein
METVPRLIVTDRHSVIRDGLTQIRRITIEQARQLAARSQLVNCVLDRRLAAAVAEALGQPLPPPLDECPEDAKYILFVPSFILLVYERAYVACVKVALRRGRRTVLLYSEALEPWLKQERRLGARELVFDVVLPDGDRLVMDAAFVRRSGRYYMRPIRDSHQELLLNLYDHHGGNVYVYVTDVFAI